MMVFENRVSTKIFGHKTNKVTGKRRRLHKEELYDLYSTPNIFPVTISRGKESTGHAACMGKNRDAYRILAWKTAVRDHLEDQGLDGSIILK